MTTHYDLLINAQQAAYQLGISPSTWRRWVKCGDVHEGVFIGRQRKWCQSYINQLKHKGAATSQRVGAAPNRGD
ncbi:hypothetical protein N8291_08920 [Pseudomonadales bacterium]|nr:hypothetical protein [Pseudomonadales bacterium]